MSTDRQHRDELPTADELAASHYAEVARIVDESGRQQRADKLAALRAAVGPRTFALPVIPEDVKAVRVRDGDVWVRADEATSSGAWCWYLNGAGLAKPEAYVLASGPLTEVLEDNRG